MDWESLMESDFCQKRVSTFKTSNAYVTLINASSMGDKKSAC